MVLKSAPEYEVADAGNDASASRLINNPVVLAFISSFLSVFTSFSNPPPVVCAQSSRQMAEYHTLSEVGYKCA
jgi:hypothetical protein